MSAAFVTPRNQPDRDAKRRCIKRPDPNSGSGAGTYTKKLNRRDKEGQRMEEKRFVPFC
jgi:hypothetical protein